MPDEKTPKFGDLEFRRQALENDLMKSLSPEQQDALAAVRAVEASQLEKARASADAELAARVAKIVLQQMKRVLPEAQLGRPARIVGHHTLICKDCGHTRPADHQSDSENPSAGGCKGDIFKSHDFYGADTEVTEVAKLEAHHAPYIEGTVAFPA